jgi:phosphopentomutase
MHDDCGPGNVQQGDAWLETNLPTVVSSSWFQDNGTVIITADEGADDSGCCGDAAGGQVPMVVISANAEGRGDISLNGNHFGSLRTIEEAFGLPLLGAASDVANGDLGQLFG